MDVLQQPLWKSKKIKFRGKVLLCHNLASAGARELHHVLNNDGTVRIGTFEDIERFFPAVTYNREDFITYNNLIYAIPDEWLPSGAINRPEVTLHEEAVGILIKEFTSSKRSYLRLLEIKVEQPLNSQLRWTQDIGVVPDWNAVYADLYYCCLEPKLRSFQIQLNWRSIVTNTKLAKFGLLDTPNCTFCGTHEETLIHLFADCSTIQPYWNSVEEFICQKIPETPSIRRLQRIFGIDKGITPKSPLINSLLTNARFLIYRGRIKGNSPQIAEYINSIKDLMKAERHIASKKGTLSKHVSKWSNFTSS